MTPVSATPAPRNRSGHRSARGAAAPAASSARPAERTADALEVADVLHAEPLVRSILREHLDLDERAGERVVVRFDERTAAESEIDGRRPAHAAVERGRPIQGIEILVDVLEAVRDARGGGGGAASGAYPRTSRLRTR